MTKLHLGCGRRHLPGYINIDNRADVGADMVMDVGNLSDVSTGTVDLIYACHVLEHVPWPQVQAVLAEWHRVLKPGGVLRVAVPDFRALCKLYRDEKVPIWRIIGPVCGRQDYPGNTHFTIWDYDYLAWHLERAGFYDVHQWSIDGYGVGLPSGWDDYSQARTDTVSISLNLEATRG